MQWWEGAGGPGGKHPGTEPLRNWNVDIVEESSLNAEILINWG